MIIELQESIFNEIRHAIYVLLNTTNRPKINKILRFYVFFIFYYSRSFNNQSVTGVKFPYLLETTAFCGLF